MIGAFRVNINMNICVGPNTKATAEGGVKIYFRMTFSPLPNGGLNEGH